MPEALNLLYLSFRLISEALHLVYLSFHLVSEDLRLLYLSFRDEAEEQSKEVLLLRKCPPRRARLNRSQSQDTGSIEMGQRRRRRLFQWLYFND
jgi:hypothetical protein